MFIAIGDEFLIEFTVIRVTKWAWERERDTLKLSAKNIKFVTIK